MAGFDSQERLFLRAYEDLAAKAEGLDAFAGDGDKLRAALAETQSGTAKADALIREMDLEARTGDPALRPSLLARLREHKIRLLALKKGLRGKGAGSSGPEGAARVQQMSSVLDSDISADDSASSAGASDPHSQLGQRERLLSSTGRLAAVSSQVGDSRKMALQAEQLGVTILQDLHSQRQSLLHSHDMLHDVDDEVSKARHVIRVMVAKMNRNKWTVGVIVFLLFAAIGLVIYLKLHL